MILPVPNLDDRTFQDIVDEAKRLIPTYCPEWTNHNLSDPGVALIELFAWMTELSLFRLNQVPDKFYTHMLNMLGLRAVPGDGGPRPTSRSGSSTSSTSRSSCPAGTQVSTSGDVGASRGVHHARATSSITQPELIAALVSPGPDAYVDVWDALRLRQPGRRLLPAHPDRRPATASTSASSDSLAGNAIRMTIAANVEGIGVIPTKPPLRWEVWQGEGWIPAHRVPRHHRRAQPRRPDHAARAAGARAADARRPAGVLDAGPRARARAGPADVPGVAADPPDPRRLDRRHGHGRAQRARRRARSLGTQHRQARPGLPGAAARRCCRATHGETIEVDRRRRHRRRGTEVPDFVASGPDDRHFVWDSTTGEVRFGPLIRYPDGTTRQHGAVPREGALIAVTGYRFGGGAAGNVGPGDARPTCARRCRTSTGSRTSPPAIGGVDAETVDNAKRRGPQSLRAGGRAVTVEDFERLAARGRPGDRPGALPAARRAPASRSGCCSCRTSSGPASCSSSTTSRCPTTWSRGSASTSTSGGSSAPRSRSARPYYQGVTIAALRHGPARPAGRRSCASGPCDAVPLPQPAHRRARRHRLAVRRRPQRGQRVPAARGGRGRRAGRGGAVLRARPAQPRARRLRQGARQARAATRCSCPPTTRWWCDERTPTDWLVHQLPVGMVEDEFLVRFLSIFQDVADTVVDQIDNLPHMFDPTVAPLPMVRTLGGWLGLDWIDPSLPDALQRRIVREYFALLRWRGTQRGMRQLLELISEAPADGRRDRRRLPRGRGAGRHRPRRAARRAVRLGDRGRPAAHRARRAAGVGDVRAVRRRPPASGRRQPRGAAGRARRPRGGGALMADIVCPECGQVTSLHGDPAGRRRVLRPLRLPAVLGARPRCRSSPASAPSDATLRRLPGAGGRMMIGTLVCPAVRRAQPDVGDALHPLTASRCTPSRSPSRSPSRNRRRRRRRRRSPSRSRARGGGCGSCSPAIVGVIGVVLLILAQ